jgi:hypothetical protein
MKKKYEMLLSNVLPNWANKHEVVLQWLSKLQRKEKRARELWLFCDWAKKTPEELLALKENSNTLEAEKLLDRFVAERTIPESMVWTSANSVRSFFAYHYRDLSKRAGVFVAEKVKPYRKPTKESLLKLWKAANNPRDRALISFTCSTAIARETLTELTWQHMEPNWENINTPHIGIPDKLLKGHGKGKWKNVEQHTFLTPEAKRDLLEYREWWERRTHRKIELAGHIWQTINEPIKNLGYADFSPLASNLTKRSGVPFSFHDARRYVETALEEAGLHPNLCRKIRGRKLKGEENPYSRPTIEQLRQAYQKAIPFLEFTTTPTINHKVLANHEEKIETQTATIEQQQRELETLKKQRQEQQQELETVKKQRKEDHDLIIKLYKEKAKEARKREQPKPENEEE